MQVVVHDTYPVPDFSWAGVVRTPPGTQAPGNCDGVCRGFGDEPVRHRQAYARIANVSGPNATVYGCWFYVFEGASRLSNAAVNVGRSFRSTTRCGVNRHFYNSSRSGDALCTHGPGDALWCTMARRQGFDSIQIQRGTAYYPHSLRRRPWSELLVCTGACATTTFSATACVPFARPATRLEAPCACQHGETNLSCAVPDSVMVRPH